LIIRQTAATIVVKQMRM